MMEWVTFCELTLSLESLLIILCGLFHTCLSGPRPLVTPSPEFLQTPVNVTYNRGDLAILYCSVVNLGTKTVVWRRNEETMPITIGKMTYIADDRYQISHVEFKNQWDLFIKDVQPGDEGIYECQVSARDKSIRRLINLKVIDIGARADIRITGPDYVEKGRSIILTCNASGILYPPAEMDWFRNGQRVTTNVHKGISISKQFSLSRKTFTSVLEIQKAKMSDDGTYVCRSSKDLITNGRIHVLNADTSNVKRGTQKDSQVVERESNNASVHHGTLLSTVWLTLLLFIFWRS